MMETTLGIVAGLVAAVLQAFSYLFSRLFMIRGGRGASFLLAASHVAMGAMALALLPFVWRPGGPPWTRLVGPTVGAAGFYLIGQLGLFRVLRRMDASRISPLLGAKLIVVAVGAAMVFGERVGPVRWAAVLLCVAAAFLLNEIGGRMPSRVTGGLLVTLTGYALSDLSIKQLVLEMGALGPTAPLLGACYTYLLCAVGALAILARQGWPTRREWGLIVPHALTWFGGMCLLFLAIAWIGVVFAGIAQSTRGIVSVGLGVALTRLGYVTLERPAPAAVVWKRAMAAAMMTAAIALYSLG
jgi:drug/metabolite transporter (DMT)-like permease